MEFKPFLYYHHADYRKKVEYKRVTNNEYIEAGKQVKSDSKLHHIKGVKDVWAFAKLSYIDIARCICYDPFHVILNFVKSLFEFLLGKRVIQPNIRKFCMQTQSHPELWHKMYEKKTKRS